MYIRVTVIAHAFYSTGQARKLFFAALGFAALTASP